MASQPLTIGESYAVSNILPTVTGITDVSNMISKISATPTISQNNNVTFGDIKIDHVEDYNDFVTQLQRDPKFERMITLLQVQKHLKQKNSRANFLIKNK